MNWAQWGRARLESCVALPLPELEGKYEILEKIREGGMGAIYKVRHRLLDEVRVIKVMRPSLDQNDELRAVDRFVREARIAIKLRHPNIAQLYDFSSDKTGNGFIVMEFIDGLSLDEVLDHSGPPSVPLALEITTQSLEALGALHETGFVHRDISPDNLMLTRDLRGRSLIKLIDLGIAKLVSNDDDEEGVTKTGTFLGKYKYASPEMFQDASGSGIDARSDLYSFGIVTYQLLTNQHPISGTDVSSVIAGHLFREPLSFDESDPEGRIPEPLRAAVLKALAKKPEDRYQTAEEMVDALEGLQEELGAEEDAKEVETLMSLRDRLREERAAKPGTGTQQAFDDLFPAAAATQVAADEAGANDATVMLSTTESGGVPGGDVTEMLDDGATRVMNTAEAAAAAAPAGAPGGTAQAAAPPAATTVTPTASPPPAAAKKNPLIFVGAALGVVILVLVGILATRGGEDSPASTQNVAATDGLEAPQGSAVEVASEQASPLATLLTEAQTAADGGDWELAEEKMLAFDAAAEDDEALVAGLSEDAQQQLGVLREELQQVRIERASESLRTALEAGDRSRVDAVLSSLTPQDEDAFRADEARAALLDDARSAVAAMSRFERALNSSEPEGALTGAFQLERSHPEVARAMNAKERAARRVEQKIDRLITEGDFRSAQASAEALRNAWPNRQGLRERAERIRRVSTLQQRAGSIFEEAERTLAEGKPHLGLQLLENRRVPPQFQQQVRELQLRLRRALQEKDGRDPQFSFNEEDDVIFEKGAPAVIHFRVRDDYEVVGVQVEARNEKGELTTMPAEEVASGEYRVTVPTSFHNDDPFYIWALAVDHSRNEGRLGASNRPIEIRRKRWFRRG